MKNKVLKIGINIGPLKQQHFSWRCCSSLRWIMVVYTCLITIGPELSTTNWQHKDQSHILFWKCPWLLTKQLLTAQKKSLNIWVSLSSCCRCGRTGCLCILCTPHTLSCVCSEDLAHDAAEVQESLEEKLSMVEKWSSSSAQLVNPAAPANGHAVKRKRAETPGREGRWWRAWSLGVCVWNVAATAKAEETAQFCHTLTHFPWTY